MCVATPCTVGSRTPGASGRRARNTTIRKRGGSAGRCRNVVRQIISLPFLFWWCTTSPSPLADGELPIRFRSFTTMRVGLLPFPRLHRLWFSQNVCWNHRVSCRSPSERQMRSGFTLHHTVTKIIELCSRDAQLLQRLLVWQKNNRDCKSLMWLLLAAGLNLHSCVPKRAIPWKNECSVGNCYVIKYTELETLCGEKLLLKFNKSARIEFGKKKKRGCF